MTKNHVALELEERGATSVKLGLTDIDGVMRGKYLTMDKFASVAADGAGFCDCIFGWDIDDVLLDNLEFSNWDKGFPDVPFRLDLATQRRLPYEGETPFFIAELIPPDGEEFHPICPRNLLNPCNGACKHRVCKTGNHDTDGSGLAGFETAADFAWPIRQRSNGFLDPLAHGFAGLSGAVYDPAHSRDRTSRARGNFMNANRSRQIAAPTGKS